MKRKAWSIEHRVKRQRSEVGSRRSEGRKKSDVRWHKKRGQGSGIRGQKKRYAGSSKLKAQREGRRQRSEVGDQKTEDGEQRERVQAGKAGKAHSQAVS